MFAAALSLNGPLSTSRSKSSPPDILQGRGQQHWRVRRGSHRIHAGCSCIGALGLQFKDKVDVLISVIDVKELDNVGVAMDTPKNGHLQLQPAVVTMER